MASLFSCKRCGYDTKYKHVLINHLKRTNICDPTLDDIDVNDLLDELLPKDKPFKCVNCGKGFSHDTSLCRHKKNCIKELQGKDVRVIQSSSNPSVRYIILNSTPKFDIQLVDQMLMNTMPKFDEQPVRQHTETTKTENQSDNASPIAQVSKSKSKSKSDTKITPAQRRACWSKYIGEGVGKTKCLCCDMNYVTQMAFQCGHVVARANGGSNDISNLRPICATCNMSMGTMDMREFANMVFERSIT